MASRMSPDEVDVNHDLKRTQTDLARLQRREWWSWGAALTIIAFLTIAVTVLCLSSMSDQILTQGQRDLVVRGLVPLIVLFGLFSIRQQILIGRLRRELATQIGVSATMEVLRPQSEAHAQGWQNRRQSERFYFDQRVKVLAGKDVFHGRTRDISEHGIAVVIPDDVPTGSRVRLEFTIQTGKPLVQVDGILRHHRGFYNGFEFVDVTPEAQQKINSACVGEVVRDVRQRVEVNA